MSEIERLIRVAAKRNAATEYTVMRFRVLRSLVDRFRRKTTEDRVSGNVIIESFLRGYLDSHPAVLAMVDQWIRENVGETPERRSPKLSKADLSEIYAAAGRGLADLEEPDGKQDD